MRKAVVLAQLYLLLTLLLLSCELKKEVGIDTVEAEKNEQENIGSYDTSGVFSDPLQIPCYQLTDEEPLKSLSLNKGYHGRVILKAEYDTVSLKFNNYEVVMTRLLHDDSEEQFIPNEDELAQLKPVLIKHVDYIKLKKVDRAGCVAPVSFHFPLTIK